MKNPFVQMAIIAAAMMEAFRENKFRDAGIELPSKGRSRLKGPKNPAGAKRIRRYYKAKHGHSGSYEEALE